MAEPPRLLLIIAQSARMLAQSAAREGFTVRAADCFGDTDTLSVVQRYIQLPSLHTLTPTQWLHEIVTLSDGEACLLICGTGIERFYSVLTHLPEHIHFCGPSAASFEQLCDPAHWIALLKQLSLPHPMTLFARPLPAEGKWLAKQMAGWGGSHVIEANAVDGTKPHYFQQHIDGISASVLFMANGHQARVLLINQQYVRSHDPGDFTLQGIGNHLQLNLQQQSLLSDALDKLTGQLKLTGLMSLDFMLTQTGDIFLLEINPRPSASCELLPGDIPFISWHIMATSKVLPPINDELTSENSLLWFCYAPETIRIPMAFDWPAYCHDLPEAGTSIPKNAVVCSLLLGQKAATDELDGYRLANNLIETLMADA